MGLKRKGLIDNYLDNEVNRRVWSLCQLARLNYVERSSLAHPPKASASFKKGGSALAPTT